MSEPVRFQHFEVRRREDGSLEELGRGAMGITYKAFDTNLRCYVALKVINGAMIESDIARQRFLREARAAAALRHPNVAMVFHLGEEGGDCFYAMEYVVGETLEHMLRRDGALPARLALEICLQVARAFGAAEKQGLIHRDIKPANLMLVEGADLTVKVIDFGLARNTESSSGGEEATLTIGGFLGTPHFASPEQLDEKVLDIRSDIYSLGVTLFYMLAGRVPFSGSVAQVMSQHLHREPPLEMLTDQPPAVIALLKRLLAKDPAGRPQTAGDLRRELEACLTVLPLIAPRPSAPVSHDEEFVTQVFDSPTVVEEPQSPALPPVPTSARKPTGLIFGGLAVIILLGGGAFLIPWRKSPPAIAIVQPTATPEEVLPVADPTPEPKEEPPPVLVDSNPGATLGALLDLQKSNPAEASPKLDSFFKNLRHSIGDLTPGQSATLREPLEEAANQGIAGAQFLLANELRESDEAQALRWFEAAAGGGDAEAMVQTGRMLARGQGMERPDLPGAAVWFQKANAAGSPLGTYYLALCYLSSEGVIRDPRRGVMLLEEAANKHEPLAINKLGDIYRRGIPGIVIPDATRSFELFSEAARLGFADAKGNLGVLYANGEGVEAPDPDKAISLWKEGAEKESNPLCMRLYAMALENGLGDLPMNADESRKWYEQAARLGDKPAQEWIEANAAATTGPEQTPNP